MGRKLLVIILFVHLWLSTAQNDDATYMQFLKDAWENIPLNWFNMSDPCSGWDGITCVNSRVTSITLSSFGLTGFLTVDIGKLTELQILDLSYNKGLTGPLPPEIGNLNGLTNLILVDCDFSGSLPDTLGNLKNLKFMALNSNGFTGPIPASIGNLKNLYWLDLGDNMLTRSIPVSNGSTPGLDMLIHTKHFHFGGNMLSGTIPPQLFNSNMTLIHVVFDNNRLTGNIPNTLGLVKSLEIIRLDGNSLSGNVPSNINNLTGLLEMYLSSNLLTGPVPDLTGLNVLNYLDLSYNTFEGQLPDAFFSIPKLQNVDLSHNKLNGTLNIGSTNSNQLQQVNLEDNQIVNFTQRSQYTIDLTLFGNPICAQSNISVRFCSLPRITNFSYLTPTNGCVSTPCNSPGQRSPNCICAYPYSGKLLFRDPSFLDLQNLTAYESLRSSMINFFRISQVPVDSVSLRNPTKNSDDNLEMNLLLFPSGYKRFNRTGVLSIVYSFIRNTTFKPPIAFGTTYIFIGKTYDFLLGEGDNSSTSGGGDNSSLSGGGDNSSSLGGGHKSSNNGVIVGSVVGGCVFVALLVLAGIYDLLKRGQAKKVMNEHNIFALWDTTKGNGDVPQLNGTKAFSFEELNTYTNNFKELNNIGTGGYGMGALDFKTEIELLSRIHHKNLVNLVGFCFDQGEQMLVYEYVVNGTVKDSLTGRTGIGLDWIRRLQIALGAAKGLQYLHDLADPPIIHRDVKTNNILLDESLVAKVADFGISKSLGDADRTHVTTEVKGTVGYMDPEYYMTQQLSEKSDVYSFGVVLLELITARSPIERGKHIVSEVKQAMNTSKELYNLHEFLDPTIGLATELIGMERYVDVALRCVEGKGYKRPRMSVVVKEIESIMELAGLNPNNEIESNSADYASEHPYDHYDNIIAYSSGQFPAKVESMYTFAQETSWKTC